MFFRISSATVLVFIMFSLQGGFAQSSAIVPLEQFVVRNDVSQAGNRLYVYARCIGLYNSGVRSARQMRGVEYQRVVSTLQQKIENLTNSATRTINASFKDPKQKVDEFVDLVGRLMSAYSEIASRAELTGASLNADPIYGSDTRFCGSIQ
jgi:hypothetical protein